MRDRWALDIPKVHRTSNYPSLYTVDMDTLSSLRRAYSDARAVYSQNVPYEVGRVEYTELPSFRGQSHVEKLELLRSEGKSAVILDVGCGKGEFLVTQKQKYGENFSYHGISSYPYHDTSRMIDQGIDVQVADIQQLHRRNTYDVIVASHSLQYAPNPLLALKRIFNALKQGGTAYIYPFPLGCLSTEDQTQLIDYLKQQYGFEIAYVTEEMAGQKWYSVSFQKTKKSLALPVSICETKEFGAGRYGVHQAIYKFNFNKA